MKPFPPDIAKRLRDHRFPEEAIKPLPKAGGLHTISSAYIVELLNDVFGPGGWALVAEVDYQLSKEKEIVASGYLQAGEVKTPKVYGSSTNKDIGDMAKGAFTAVLSKASSYWGIGLYVYKGDLDRSRKTMSNITEKLLEKMKWDGVVHADGSVYLEGDTGRYPIYLDEASLKLCRSLSKTWTDGHS